MDGALLAFKDAGIVSAITHCDAIEVLSWSGHVDTNWVFTDGHGDTHWYSRKGDRRYPTLIWIVDCEESEDYPEEGHYECAICGERIVPGWITPTGFCEYIPGPLKGEITFSDGKRTYMNGDDLYQLDIFSHMKYDYGFSKLRAFLQELKDRRR